MRPCYSSSRDSWNGHAAEAPLLGTPADADVPAAVTAAATARPHPSPLALSPSATVPDCRRLATRHPPAHPTAAAGAMREWPTGCGPATSAPALLAAVAAAPRYAAAAITHGHPRLLLAIRTSVHGRRRMAHTPRRRPAAVPLADRHRQYQVPVTLLILPAPAPTHPTSSNIHFNLPAHAPTHPTQQVKPEAKSYYTLAAATLRFNFPKPSFLDGVTSGEKPVLAMKKVSWGRQRQRLGRMRDVLGLT